ncbi:hypothetical protein LCGC14_0616780 [marine sediment metagenome]|uniref:Uncharacterized protein n=1 Tax=marine sediment metagenome TaxID=412755 RepID=A0A0F9TSC6_9ZZZZ
MGVDCYLFDGKKYHSLEKYHGLDRWYVFDSFFDSKKKYTKEEMVERFNRIIDLVKLTSDIEWDDVFMSDKDYYMRLVMKAKEIVEKSDSDSFTFFTDDKMPDEFYEPRKETEKNGTES